MSDWPIRGKPALTFPECIKLEVGRMLQEGVSEEGIKVVVDAMKETPVMMGDLSYSAFVEYGMRPDGPVVEGSVIYPITDEQRLLPEAEP